MYSPACNTPLICLEKIHLLPALDPITSYVAPDVTALTVSPNTKNPPDDLSL